MTGPEWVLTFILVWASILGGLWVIGKWYDRK